MKSIKKHLILLAKQPAVFKPLDTCTMPSLQSQFTMMAVLRCMLVSVLLFHYQGLLGEAQTGQQYIVYA